MIIIIIIIIIIIKFSRLISTHLRIELADRIW